MMPSVNRGWDDDYRRSIHAQQRLLIEQWLHTRGRFVHHFPKGHEVRGLRWRSER